MSNENGQTSNNQTGQTMSNYSGKGFNSSSAVTSKFTPSSKGQPCPVCKRTQDGDCRVQEQGNVVLCHTHQTGKEGEQTNGYTFLRSSDKGAGWGVWVWAGDKPIKTDRPKVEPRTTYYYDDRSGNKLIRVQRQKGKSPEFWQEYFLEDKWVPAGQVSDAVKGQMRKAVPVYRYAEVREAIAVGLTVVWCEGEVCADALWLIGVPATTSIGGSNSYSSWGNYSKDLEGATVAIAPDRDEQGMKYAEEVAKDQNCDNWLFAFPKSPLWNLALPKGGGLDIADWIAEGATKDDVLGAIKIGVDVVDGGVGNGVGRQNSMKSGVDGDVDVVGRAIERDEILESLRESIEVETASADRIDPYRVFPKELADAVVRVARSMPCPVEALITAIMAVSASIIGTSSLISPDDGWDEPVVFWGMIVGQTGAMKSSTLSAVVKPLIRLQAKEERRYELVHQDWAKAKRQAEKEKEDFDEPEPLKKEYYLDDATFEAFGHKHKENPRGFLMLLEEMDAFFAGMNKHRSGGKGDDQQRWLSVNTGGQIKVDKLSRQLFIQQTAASFIGTIQTDTVLPTIRKPENNISGMNSRWNYCAAPFPSALDRVKDKGSIKDLQELLLTLYQRLAQIPGGEKDEEGELIQVRYYPDPKGGAFFNDEWQVYAIKKMEAENHPGFRAVWAKQRGFAARNAGILHMIAESLSGNEQLSKVIKEDKIRGGVAIAQFFVNQAKSLYGIAGTESSEETEWTPVILKMKEASLAAKATDGWIKPREARIKTRLIKSSNHAKSVFAKMFESGIGELDTSAATTRWRWVDSKDEIDEIPVNNSNNVNKPCDAWFSPVNNNGNKPVNAVNNVDSTPTPLNSTVEILNGNLKGHQPIPPIAIGDEVTVLDTTSPYKGRIGEVKELISTPTGETLYRVARDYEGTPELNFEATFSQSSVRVRPKKNYTWEPA